MLGLGLGIPHQNMVESCGIVIGCTHQGGIIFWLDGSGGGLIAAPADETASQYGCYAATISGADGTAIETGAQNTIDILAESCGATADIAADRCRDKTTGGYTDWFLPSRDELVEMGNTLGPGASAPLTNIAGFDCGPQSCYHYWSSTESDIVSSILVEPFDGSFTSGQKSLPQRVRAIRAF